MDTIKKRVGKDLHIIWPMTASDELVPLSSCDLLVEIVDPLSHSSFPEFKVSDDDKAIEFDMFGTVYTEVGTYTFIVWRNYGKVGQTVYDTLHAVTLVSHTRQEHCCADESDIVTECVTLTPGVIEVGMKGEKGDPMTWDDLTPEQKASLVGPPGEKGEQGIPGPGTTIKGTFGNYAEFVAAHPRPDPNDAYIVGANIYVYVGGEWTNAGNLQGPVGPRGANGRDGEKGDKMTYADLSEGDKDDLRRPALEEAEKASESSAEARRQALLAKVAAQEANDASAATSSAMSDIQAKLDQIIAMGGQAAADIIASLDIANIVALLTSKVQVLEQERLFVVSGEDWDRMTSAQQTAILEAHINVGITEGSGSSEGKASFENGTLTLSENSTFAEGVLTLADCEFVDNTLTLKN